MCLRAVRARSRRGSAGLRRHPGRGVRGSGAGALRSAHRGSGPRARGGRGAAGGRGRQPGGASRGVPERADLAVRRAAARLRALPRRDLRRFAGPVPPRGAGRGRALRSGAPRVHRGPQGGDLHGPARRAGRATGGLPSASWTSRREESHGSGVSRNRTERLGAAGHGGDAGPGTDLREPRARRRPGREGSRAVVERRLASGNRGRRLCDARRALGLRIPDRRRRGVRSGQGRHHLGGRGRIRHLLRRAHVHDRPHGAGAFREEGDPDARPLPDGPRRHGLGRRASPDDRRARPGPPRRRPLGRRERLGRQPGAFARRGERLHERGRSLEGQSQGQGAAAAGDGNARIRQPLSRAPGRGRDLRRRDRARVRRSRRATCS